VCDRLIVGQAGFHAQPRDGALSDPPDSPDSPDSWARGLHRGDFPELHAGRFRFSIRIKE